MATTRLATPAYANSYLKSITDNALGMISYFEYDREGNRTREAYYNTGVGAARIDYQLADISYDELNRIKTFTDAKAQISYDYDAVGNRRRVLSYYHDGLNGAQQTQDYWYKYDTMNRFTLTKGQFSGSAGSGSIGPGHVRRPDRLQHPQRAHQRHLRL